MTTHNEVQSKRRSDLRDPVEQLRRMFEIRYFEEEIVGLFSEGLVHGTTHTCQGQEALNIGLAVTLNSDDFVACTYRSHGFALASHLRLRSVKLWVEQLDALGESEAQCICLHPS